jgi:hypothetical protein
MNSPHLIYDQINSKSVLRDVKLLQEFVLATIELPLHVMRMILFRDGRHRHASSKAGRNRYKN